VTRTDDPVPQTCTVSSCSLREAVIAANNNLGTDIIWLTTQDDGNGGEYRLTLEGIDDTAQNGDLDILDDLTIQHIQWPDKNNDQFHIIADMNDCVIDVHPDVSLSLVYGVISDGYANGSGGGIRANEAELFVQNCDVKSNRASQGGAFILQNSYAEINSSLLSSNEATDRGGGIYMSASSQLVMDDVRINYNTAKNGSGLYFGYLTATNSEPNVHLKKVSFHQNQADFGGALNAQGSFGETTGAILVEDTSFRYNNVERHGGAIYHL